MQPDRPIIIFFPPEVLDPRVLEAWAPAAEARITRGQERRATYSQSLTLGMLRSSKS